MKKTLIKRINDDNEKVKSVLLKWLTFAVLIRNRAMTGLNRSRIVILAIRYSESISAHPRPIDRNHENRPRSKSISIDK